MLEKITLNIAVLQGAGLVAKDRNIFGKKTTSDPFVEVWVHQGASLQKVGQIKTVYKTLDPIWNPSGQTTISFSTRNVQDPLLLLFKIYDADKLSAPDAMGTVQIPIILLSTTGSKQVDTTQWYEVPPESAKNASGKIQIRLQTEKFYARSLVRGNTFELASSGRIRVGLAWDLLPGNRSVDLDVSCVALSAQGQFILSDTVYYGNTCNSTESIIHSGDQQDGSQEGDDETIVFDLGRVPRHVLALYLVLAVATPPLHISDIQSMTLRVYDIQQQLTVCTFSPAKHALSRDATAMFMARMARTETGIWVLSQIEDTHPTARDFGSLIPQLKSYTRDLLPSIHVDPTELVAILRKGGNVRLGHLPKRVTFGLAWDVTDGVNIDLDASAICLDSNLQVIDMISFKHLKSNDGSIIHQGDEREGDEVGDDEKLDIYLDRVDPRIQYIGFVINSYSGQELDDVARTSCHLFDPATNQDMASYAMTDSKSLDGYTALLLGCLYRGMTPGEWCMCIISEAHQGKVVKQNVGDLQKYLRRSPPIPPADILKEEEAEIVVYSCMPPLVPLVDEDINLAIPLT